MSIRNPNSKFNLINNRIKYGTDGGINVDAGTLFVDVSNGRVGVGTLTPQATLDVSGSIKFSSLNDSANSSGSNTQVLTKVNNNTLWSYPQYYLRGSDFIPSNTSDLSQYTFTNSDVSAFAGGVLAPNGKIYGIPFNSTYVPIIDPINNTVDTTTITGLTGTQKWEGGVCHPNGNIYCIPYDSQNVLIINTFTNTVNITTFSGFTGSAKWSGGVLAPNGKIYGVPYNSTNVLVIDPSNNTATQSTITGLPSNASKWSGGVLGTNGNIYCMPYDSSSCLIINPLTDTSNNTTITGLTGSAKWFGGVLAPNSRIYGMPHNSSKILQLKASLPTIPNWSIAPQFNKF